MNIRTLSTIATAVFFLTTTTMTFGQVAAPPPANAPLFAVLLGGNEVGTDGQANVGDPDGRGSATIVILPISGILCFATLVSGIDTPVAAHIHRAPPGQNGPIVVPLTPPTQGNPGGSSGCAPNVDPALLAAIEQNPETFYVNVHTVQFPEGALRGQLF